MENHRYTLSTGKLKRSYRKGFQTEESGRLVMTEGSTHILIPRRYNSYRKGSVWGRLHFQSEVPQGCMMRVLAFAADAECEEDKEEVRRLEEFFQREEITPEEKAERFLHAECREFIGQNDLLLYDLEGQYLWICIEITGSGSGYISRIELDSQGDNFMQTFPEIYQEQGGFFHRYLSVFSSIYNDINQELQQIDKYLDLDTAPSSLLPLFADWLGFQLEGEFLEENVLRRLVKESYSLNRMKGTNQAMKKLISLVLGEEAIIVERSMLEGYLPPEHEETLQRLYGESPQDATILVNRPADEKLQAQLLFLIRQFKPVRSRVHLVFYQDCDRLDSYCYLDRNASLAVKSEASLNKKQSMDGVVVLR